MKRVIESLQTTEISVVRKVCAGRIWRKQVMKEGTKSSLSRGN